MMSEGMEVIEKKIQQVIALIERLREENANLKNKVGGLNEQIQQLQEAAGAMQSEREELKGKIDSAVSMLDKVDLDDVLDSIAEEVAEETEDAS